MENRNLKNGLSLLILFLPWITSCSVGPPYRPPYLEIPTEWKHSQDCRCKEEKREEFVYLDFWWEVFHDEVLNGLEEAALENNRDLFVAWERVNEALALMGVARSGLYPQINLNPQYTNTGELIKIFGVNSGIFRAHELLYFFPLNVSYELDLWGKIRDLYNASIYNWEGQIKDYEAVMLALTSDLAGSYFQLRALDTQKELLLSTLKTRQKAFEINSSRYDGEITFYASVTQAGEEVDTVLTQYQEVVRERALLEDLIATLIGSPASEFCLEERPLKDLPPCIPEGIPSEVLLRRPDVAEAEFVMKSTHAQVKYAYSLFFPSLTLTGVGGFESPLFKDFMSWISRFWMFGASSNQIVFDGFRTYYGLEAEIARFQEASGAYQEIVLQAFQEVEDALANLDSYSKQYESTEATIQWAEKTYELYLDRYLLGVTYYIDVVNSERDLLAYQITYNQLLSLRYLATIQLIKALGGGWGVETGCE